jgi:2-dehydro-3-deoxygalactonokinase
LGAWDCDPMPLVVSGMASSTIGWREVPYAQVPLRLDGSNLQFEHVSWDHPTYLISGLATEDEMMRGEETEAIGLLHDFPRSARCLLILPGTHSKHLRIEGGAIVSLTTFMTGELFEVLARHSILKATVDAESAEVDLVAFDEGVERVLGAGLGASLFQARARGVLRGASAQANKWFLSGVLIGGEIQTIHSATLVMIGGSSALRQLYGRALRQRPEIVVRDFSEAVVAGAVPRAHRLFLETHGLASKHS